MKILKKKNYGLKFERINNIKFAKIKKKEMDINKIQTKIYGYNSNKIMSIIGEHKHFNFSFISSRFNIFRQNTVIGSSFLNINNQLKIKY
tara:strand:- start:4049 stop:4318 length:270 start_codon:yes stop_codon:yes gene_type:complete